MKRQREVSKRSHY